MKISLTEEQYKTLIKVVYLGTYMATLFRDVDEVEEYEKLADYIYSFCTKFNMEKYFDYDDRYKVFYVNERFSRELGVDQIIEDYDEIVFWEDLESALAIRDMVEKYGESEIDKMDRLKFIEEKFEISEIYREEFAKNGIKNLRIVKQ